ncbi:MAG: Transcription elongation factor GreA [Chlamydiales bacterium]|nr:Transcription elongation factor GreA [Chlamydiales bacterium]MCH9619569.1 Transcription elongation factor GreA [Chlamydiales bacterium]MCH9623175.1 Transcription elongation factor GreA [Chlamydiales bacterium]
MSYLEKFQSLLDEEKLSPVLHLWEEYCMGDDVNGEELYHLLKMFKDSRYGPAFGHLIETALPMWEKIKDEEVGDNILRLIIDLQTTNTPFLADLATHFLSTHYKEESDFSEKMRIVGLRTRHSFQGSITNYELLSHMQREKFVFHTGGWGVGEVIELSLLQEHAIVEFEGVVAPKDLSFENAFKNLIFLPSDHFLARRFGNPDKLESEGKEDPVWLVRLLLRDLGPKTAQEIKEELSELVIPEDEWSKWWQGARTKVKKDTKIQSPKSSKGLFELRDEEVTHETSFKEALLVAKTTEALISTAYHFVRDFPEVLKSNEIKQLLKERMLGELESGASVAQKIQLSFLLEDVFPAEFPQAAATLIQSVENLETVLFHFEILAFKKRVLVTIREVRPDWDKLFLQLLFVVSQNILRDYLFKELQQNEETTSLASEKIHELLHNMTLYVEPFFWYFQKLLTKEEGLPYSDEDSMRRFLESYFILLHYIEEKAEYKDLAKKMYNLLLAKRYQIIRSIIEGASVEYLKEFLLLASKCLIFTKHDQRILRSLAEVVQPSLSTKKKGEEEEEVVIWTTAEGYEKLKKRIQEIGTVEMIDNAREIEAARAHGDLRENSEYKFALERRSQLQAELKVLSTQLNKARILSKHDVSTSTVGPGSIVSLKNGDGKQIKYTLLGPWDADTDQNILSFQSKFAQAMMGHKEGEAFDFHGNHYEINSIQSYLSE